LTLLVAANAQGKTSVLEAAYVAATTRSFRSPDPREAIRHGAERFTVFAGLQDGETLAVDRGRQRGDRRLYVGKYEVKLDEYLDYLQALVLTGQSSREIAGSPAERRRSIDRATAAASAGHLPDLGEYRRALSQRNRLLKAEAPDAELEPWEQILARAGERITARRRQQLEAWQNELGSWPELFPEGREARVEYKPSGGSGDVLERLERAREQDRRNGVTGVGPHRDDLQMTLAGVDLWRYGSAGQVRASIAALTLAQVREVRRARRRHAPLLILDDVDTDLDPNRVRALLAAASEEAQVLAATTKRFHVHDLSAALLQVEGGRVSRD
jgi:DNA replication and repair protein RecF